MKQAAMVVAVAFTSYGVDHHVGEVIQPNDYKEWPEGTLENRVAGGFIRPAVIDGDAADTAYQSALSAAREQADQIVTDARTEAARLVTEAKAGLGDIDATTNKALEAARDKADAIVKDAHTDAEKIRKEARDEADKIRAQAKTDVAAKDSAEMSLADPGNGSQVDTPNDPAPDNPTKGGNKNPADPKAHKGGK